MEDNRETWERPYPFPLRSSELVGKGRGKKFFAELQRIEPILLTPEECQDLNQFDQELFGEFEPLQKLSPEIHTVYPDFFLTDQGWRLFQLAYLDPDLEGRVESLAKQRGVPFEKTSEKKRFFDTYFDELEAAAESEKGFQEYLEARGVKIRDATKPSSREEATRFFFGLDLTSVPTRIHQRISQLSSDYARNQFLEAFCEHGGAVEEIANPYRVSRVVNVDKLIDKLAGYRNLKRKIKSYLSELGKKAGNLPEAKATLAQIYLRYLNVLIGGMYDEGRVLASQPQLTEKEEEALGLIRGGRRLARRERFADEQASRTMPRIDRFLQGVGLRVKKDGFSIEAIPKRLREFIEERGRQAETAEPKEPSGKKEVNADQAVKLAEAVLRVYGFDQKGWSVYLSPRARTLKVNFREKGEKVREIQIPGDLKRNLVGVLVALAHEIEGHVLRYENQEEMVFSSRLAEEFSTGRGRILSEGSGMWVQDQTKKLLVGKARPARPYYGLMLLEKQKGGSFRDCFRTYLDTYTKREGITLESLIESRGELIEAEERAVEKGERNIFKKAYSAALRIFRRRTPLDDESGSLPDTRQLAYLEQELVVQVLFEQGLGKLLFLGGIDLYSLHDLARLSSIDWDEIREPEFAVAKKIWPRLKQALDEGKNLDEAIKELKAGIEEKE